ncbi:MAG: hypothetical protein M5U09_03455 [Gammaproteobacteria bacterium]|nr:hypothetical protein [Gammaproteobacteria bacterium]
MHDIQANAAVSIGSIYNHFGGKEGVAGGAPRRHRRAYERTGRRRNRGKHRHFRPLQLPRKGIVRTHRVGARNGQVRTQRQAPGVPPRRAANLFVGAVRSHARTAAARHG